MFELQNPEGSVPFSPIIDCLQYVNWSRKSFQQLRDGGVDAIHVTIAYHENFREMVLNLERWNQWFEQHSDLIFKATGSEDISLGIKENRTAVFFGLQNPSPIEDDIGLVEICHQLGVRIMQLSYNNQSLLATGCYETEDTGITRFGKEVITEMNRVGMVIDMSHSGDRSTFEAIELSSRPIAITHANPKSWYSALRNKSDDVIKALTRSDGMFGFSLYPHHLKEGTQCSLVSFCQMIARAVDQFGIDHFGIGSDLCQDQPNEVVSWMRNGRWSRSVDYGEGSKTAPGFPEQPDWFKDNRDFPNIVEGLRHEGFSETEIAALMGGNWHRFFDNSFKPTLSSETG